MNKLFVGGAMVLTLALCACGNTAQTRNFTANVTGKTSSLGDFSAAKGDTINLTITTDADEEIHLHGYDIHFDCKKGVPLQKTFTADKTGTFEYELEATSDHLGNFTVNP